MAKENDIDLDVLIQISYGMFIVSAVQGEQYNAQIASVAFQVTNEPVQLAICLHRDNLTHQMIMQSKAFGIGILSQRADLKFIGGFGFHSGRGVDKFAKVKFKTLATGSPLVLERTSGILDLDLVKTMDVGTHTIFVGELRAAEVLSGDPPLTYDYYHRVIRGKSHGHAPTFRISDNFK